MPDKHDFSSSFEDFGSLLKYLRRRARLTQKELSVALGYSESQISRLETNDRLPDISAIYALFVPALALEQEPEIAARLLELAENQSKKALKNLHLPMEVHDGLFKQSLLSRKSNLPKIFSSFVGRERETEQVCELLGRQTPAGLPALRLVTLTGSGGVGKTRLSIHVGEALESSQPDGVWMAELAPLADQNMVPNKLMQVFNLPGDSSRSMITVLIEYLRTRRTILILDNCEHLIEGANELAKALLENCPGLQILATSREPLGMPGEITYRVPSLTLSDQKDSWDHELPNAVRLFVDRAQSVRPDFTLTPETLPVIAQICRRLDGIPLAIELAAARMNILSVGAIAGRLDDAFHLLASGSQTLLPRQQSLRASIDWSYKLLSPVEQKLLMRLSVFAGRWSLEAAERICSDENEPKLLPQAQVLDLLAQLVGKSLVVADTSQDEPRYHLHEVIRQFAQEHFQGKDDHLAIHKRHLDYFLNLSESCEPYLRGPNQVALLDQLLEEIDNIRAALAFSLLEPSMAEKGLRLAAALRWLWNNRNLDREGALWLENLLSACPPSRLTWPEGIAARARALADWAFFRTRFRNFDNQPLLEESQTIYQSLGDAGKAGMVWGLNIMEINAYLSGDMQRGRQRSKEAVALAEELGDRFYLAEVLDNSLSYALDLDEELRIVDRSLSLRRYLGDVDGIYSTLFFRSHLYSRMGNGSQALQDAREAMKYAQISKNQRGIHRVLFSMGRLYFSMGEFQECFVYYNQALARVRHFGDDGGVGNWLIQVSGVAIWLKATTTQDYGAENYLVEALEMAQRLSNVTIEAEATFYLAELLELHREGHKALGYFGKAASLFAQVDGPRAARLHQYSLGKAALLSAESKMAVQHFLAALRLAAEQRNPWEMLHTMAALAVAKVSCHGDEELAVRLQGTVDAMRPLTKIVDPALELFYLPYAPEIVLSHAGNVLGETHCASAYAKGQSMTLEQAAASIHA